MAYLQTIDQKQAGLARCSATSSPLRRPPATRSGMIPAGTDKQDITYDPSVMAAYAKTATDKSADRRLPDRPTQRPEDGEHRRRGAAGDGLNAKAQGYTTARCSPGPRTPPRARTPSSTPATAPTAATPTCGATSSGTSPVASTTSCCDVPSVNATLDQAVATGDTEPLRQGRPGIQGQRLLLAPVQQQRLDRGPEVDHRDRRSPQHRRLRGRLLQDRHREVATARRPPGPAFGV